MVVNGMAAAYSLVHAVRCVVGMMKGSVLFSKPLAWAIFSGDQVYSVLLCFLLFGLCKRRQLLACVKWYCQ